MLCSPRYPGIRIGRGSEPAVSSSAWLRPLVGLTLALAGLMLVVAGMPGLTSPAITELEVRSGVPEIDRSVERTAMVAPVRLGWTSTPLQTWSRATGSDLATRDRQTSERVAREAPSQPRERFLGEGMGRNAVAPFAGWDLREVLKEMANDQHGFWHRQCPCPMGMTEKGPR